MRKVWGLRMRLSLVILASVVLTFGCELFEASPFPEYLSKIITEHRYSERIGDLFPQPAEGQARAPRRYQLFPLTYGTEQRLYFLISPGIDTTNLAGSRAILLYLNGDGEFQEALEVPTGDEYTLRSNFGLPFLLSRSGHTPDHILAGRITIDPDTHDIVAPLIHPLGGGYGIALNEPGGTRNGTYLLAGKDAVANGYFALEIIAFGDMATWSPLPPTTPKTINIVPESAHVDVSTAPLGHRLSGIIQNATGADFLIEHLATKKLSIWALTNTDIIDYQQNGSSTSLMEQNSTSTRAEIDLTNSDFFTYTDEFILVHRSTGSFDRYSIETADLIDSIRTERRVGILYSFSRDGRYMYRLDPEILSLQVIATWWQE